MLLEHQPVTRKYRTHQVIYALAWLEEILEGKIFEISAPQLRNSFLGYERRGWADLAVGSNDKSLSAAQQCRQFSYVGLRCFVDNDEIEYPKLRGELLCDPPRRHDPAGNSVVAAGHGLARHAAVHAGGFPGSL